jgi:predicted peptidase
MTFWQPFAVSILFGFMTLSHSNQSVRADDSAPREAAVRPGEQQARNLDRTVRVELDYLLYLPKEYAQQPAWPLLLFLHGAGERGENLDLVKAHGPPKLIATGKEFPFIVVSPQCRQDHWWQAFELAALLDDIEAIYKVDQDRIYVTGLSMGGYGTWSLAAYQPRRLAAILPICGGGNPHLASVFKSVPAWVFHGAKDTIVPLDRSRVMVDALEKAGGTVKFTIYPEANHDAWTETYANPEVYQWLLQQKQP